MDGLPIDEVMPRVLQGLEEAGAVVLVAPPGAGKTTRVPTAVLDAGLAGGGRILMLEPRRVAARAAARFMARERGQAVGEDVGYAVRFERRAGPRTRILVMTERLLTRRLQEDPFLDGVSVVILDEFHERSLDVDLALALLREVRRDARPDLKLIVMSATLDPQPVAAFLGDATIVRSEGRGHPVDVTWIEEPDDRPLPHQVSAGVRRLLPTAGGGILVFLPGAGEITRCREALAGLAQDEDLDVLPLHGDLTGEAQDRALVAGARRRVILATNVAESSLTLDGIGAVLDSGRVRRLRHDPRLGMDRLELGWISRASAEQRAGRAGRQGPGVALRLWTRARHREMAPVEEPEIRRADLAPVLLELLAWGVEKVGDFPWFDKPGEAEVASGLLLLEELGATRRGRLTGKGRRLLALPVHPRLGCLLLAGEERGCAQAAAWMAALCSERDVLASGRAFSRDGAAVHPTGPSDLLLRLDLIREVERRRLRGRDVRALDLEPRAVEGAGRVASQLRRLVRGSQRSGARHSEEDLLRVVLAGFPDRVSRRRADGDRRAVMVGGRGLELDESSVVREAPLFVAVSLDGGRRGTASRSRARLASAVDPSWLHEDFADAISSRDEVVFDAQTERVVGWRHTCFRDLPIRSAQVSSLDPDQAARCLEEALRAEPERVLGSVGGEGELGAYVTRVRCLGVWRPELGLPAWTDDELVEALASLCPGRRSFQELREVPLRDVLVGGLTHAQTVAVREEAPAALELPSGRRARLRYAVGRPPVLSARVQELFGLLETPTVAGGRIACQIEILGPHRRPVQVTSDLASFWRNTYPRVRKDLRARYPKHAWPEVPPGLSSS